MDEWFFKYVNPSKDGINQNPESDGQQSLLP